MKTPLQSFLAIIAFAAFLPAAQTAGLNHRFLQVNGIKMHIAEQGQGPLVVLAHGFPGLWYNWRHVLPLLAAAGYHVVAPDLRGYGQTDAPPNIQDYSQFQIVGDMVGLVRALGYEEAVIVGNDWGATTAYNSALLRPDIFRAVVLVNIPFSVRTADAVKPSEANRRRAPAGQVYYQTYYQQPGVESELDADPMRSMRMILYSTSGSIPKQDQTRYTFGVNEKLLDARSEPKQLPAWLKPEDLDYYAKEFKRTGFRGGVNWYRTIDMFWEATPFLVGRKLLQPTLFIAGADDPFIAQVGREGVDNLERSIPNLSKKVELPGIGHQTEQESPAEVSRLVIEFLREVDAAAPRARAK
jgi:pimeloyl-ACP methyl ester carboxylesterase